MGGGGGGLAHASRLASEEPKISRRRDSRAEGWGSAPGLMPRGFLPRGKRRDAGCNSTSRRLPNVAINLPGSLSRRFLARGNHGKPNGIWGFQTSPKWETRAIIHWHNSFRRSTKLFMHYLPYERNRYPKF